jgi:hypothetical protein
MGVGIFSWIRPFLSKGYQLAAHGIAIAAMLRVCREASQQKVKRRAEQTEQLDAVGGIERRSFTDAEQGALRRANLTGWLILGRDLPETTLAVWQNRCESSAMPLAVLQPEATRATVWIFLTAERAWTRRQQALVERALAQATGVVLTNNGVSAFLPPRLAVPITRKLVALARSAAVRR